MWGSVHRSAYCNIINTTKMYKYYHVLKHRKVTEDPYLRKMKIWNKFREQNFGVINDCKSSRKINNTHQYTKF